jgi:hypothetical protein
MAVRDTCNADDLKTGRARIAIAIHIKYCCSLPALGCGLAGTDDNSKIRVGFEPEQARRPDELAIDPFWRQCGAQHRELTPDRRVSEGIRERLEEPMVRVQDQRISKPRQGENRYYQYNYATHEANT